MTDQTTLQKITRALGLPPKYLDPRAPVKLKLIEGGKVDKPEKKG